ncbi:carbohydrate ABC transporter permease [Antribacter gilvus]|uniref:carbohydrate ABC transporter permease n=1 Tax=Antribacter gilvus TaxID=2304675 RepID=UPI001F0C9F99|nr:carbohydrate ABC transporter permease [Antribacter gilvus]
MSAVESRTVQAGLGIRPQAGPARTSGRGGPARRVGDVVWGLVAVAVFAMSAFPVYWMINTSFLPNSAIRGEDIAFFPTPDLFTMRNYVSVITDESRAAFTPAMWNSIWVTTLTVFLAMILGFLASLALTRFKFKGRRTFILLILVVQMLPGEAMFISLFRIIDSWHMLNTVIGLVLVYLAGVLPFTIWTLRGFVNGVPAELEEAAMIDGCTKAGAFWRVTFPLLAPGLVATGVFALIQAWNEFILALIIMSRPESMTLPIWLRTFQQANEATNWGAMMAGSTLVALPVVIFFLFVQGRMTGGLVSGAVKG